MPSSLDEAKQIVRSRLLGHHGVHAVGLRRSANAVAVYVDKGAGDAIRGLVSGLKKELQPYDVVVVSEERPSITAPASDRKRR